MGNRVYDYIEELRNDYVAAFKRTLNEHPGLPVLKLHELAIESGARQWYCSVETALKAIAKLDKGEHDDELFANPHKRRKYEELRKRVHELEQNTRASRIEAVELVIFSPAPSFYMAPRTARWYYKEYRRNRKSTL